MALAYRWPSPPPHPKPHSRRPTLQLPKHVVEGYANGKALEVFNEKVQELVRQRRADREENADHVINEAAEEEDSSPLQGTGLHNVSSQKSLPWATPRLRDEQLKVVEPKYLYTALVQCGSDKATAVRLGRLPRIASKPRIALESPATPKSRDLAPFRSCIVEAPTSVRIKQKTGEEIIPLKTWLVLEQAGLPDGGVCVLNSEVGGGCVLEEDAPQLRLVADDRLHAFAAEANFQRASKGISVTALKHAAYALQLFGQDSKDDTWRVPCATFERPKDRFDRLEPMVLARAHASQTRAEVAEIRSLAKATAPLRNSGGIGDTKGMRGRKLARRKGLWALAEFLDFAHRRAGNLVRAWFTLDTEENLTLGRNVFVRRSQEMGFTGNIPALWQYLDAGDGGSISLVELDAGSALILADMKIFFEKKFGGFSSEVFRMLDAGHSGHVTKIEFITQMRSWGFKSGTGVQSYSRSAELFEMLDRRGFGYIVEEDLNFLTRWRPRPYLTCKADFNLLVQWKDMLFEVYEQPAFKSWRKLLDPECTMRIPWFRFCAAWKELKRKHSRCTKSTSTLPANEDHVATVWKALDSSCSGWISLREFDEPSYDALATFKRWADRVYGGAAKAFYAIDGSTFGDGNGKLTMAELRRSCCGADPYPGDVEFLFDTLDVDNCRKLFRHDMEFLDHWDLDWEEWETFARTNHAGCTTYVSSQMDLLRELKERGVARLPSARLHSPKSGINPDVKRLNSA